jgi:serine/threonine-protein kinase
MIADLEDVLAIETSRAGGTSGQATSILRTLPSGTRSRVPFRIRRRSAAVALLLVVAAAVVALVVYSLTRAHSGTPAPRQPAPARHLRAVSLCQTCAHDYNPDAIQGPKDQNPGQVGAAIDGNPDTSWSTDTYYSGSLQKPGVGLYVDASPGVAAAAVVIDTSTPGFTAQILARNTPVDRNTFGGWTQVAPNTVVRSGRRIGLSSHTRYRFYLVWITKLPPNRRSASLGEVTLYRSATQKR